MVTPKTFLVIVGGILAFAYVTQSIMPGPYWMVKQVDNVAMSVLQTMAPQTDACASQLYSSEC